MPPSDKTGQVIPLSRIRAALARPRGAKRIDALLSHDDAAAAVAALPVPELYFLVKDVGFGDATDLIALATPEQIRGCIDLDIWERDRVQLDGVMPWLTAVVEAGFDKVGEVWRELDPELAALILARTTKVVDRTLEEVVDEGEDRPIFTTPDTFFDIILTSDSDEDLKLVHRIVEDLYRADMVLAQHTIMAARSEPESELEEMSYRWRSGRLADLGYVDFYDALEVFRPLDPHTVEIGEDTADRLRPAEDGEEARTVGELPAPMLDQVVGRVFLARALEQISNAAEAERLQSAIVVLVNKVLSAARVSPGDEDAVKVGTEHATATLALGLEHVAGGSVDRAVEALGSISLTRLHRLGYTLSLRLARFAAALAPRSATSGDLSTSVLSALLAARPFFARELEEPAAGGVRPFETRADIRVVADHLTELALRLAIADALGADLLALARAPEPRPALDDFPRTAIARLLGGGVLESTPLSMAELAAFRDGAFEAGVARRDALRVATDALAAALDRAEVVESRERLPGLVARWLGDLASDFAGLPAGEPIDLRFTAGVITSASKD